jgi:hypothetical protein
MKYTLLDLTQTILSSIDGDEINSINDSVESQQVVKIIRSAYFDLIARAGLPEHNSLVTLDASTDPLKPVLMTLPSSVNKISWVKYNACTVDNPEITMEHVQALPLEEFLNRMHSLDTTSDSVSSFNHTIGADTFTVMYKTDKAPSYYTTFDDNTFIFDSYDSAVDGTLQKSKTLVLGSGIIPFTLSDTFIPDLDEPQFALLLNEAKALASAELRQIQHPKAEINAKRGWSTIQKNKTAIETSSDFDKLPNFGRK